MCQGMLLMSNVCPIVAMLGLTEDFGLGVLGNLTSSSPAYIAMAVLAPRLYRAYESIRLHGQADVLKMKPGHTRRFRCTFGFIRSLGNSL